MAVKDLINQISRSKIVSKAKDLFDRDKEREGVQFISPNIKQDIRNFMATPVPSYLQKPTQQLAQFSQRAEQSPFGIPLRTAKNLGQQILSSTEALKQRQDLINQRTQGKNFIGRIKSTPTSQENKLLLEGLKSAPLIT
jgi:hypothetical protein